MPMKMSITCIHLLLFLCVSCLAVWCSEEMDTNVAPMEKAELAALYSAIQGFAGNGWNGSDLYPDPCGWTPIQGVSCDIFDGLWYITALSFGPIHENSLGCAKNVEFRPQLFGLKHLKSLSFFSCFMSPRQRPMAIPTENWSELAGSLETLEFRSNPGLVGHVPATIGGLTKLQSLVLLENRLTGQIPANIGNLSSLKRIVLAGNSFTSGIPDSFRGLSHLLILDLSRNSLSGSLPLSFGCLTSLLKLDLSNNQLEGMIPRAIGNLKNLTLLDLRNNKLSGGLTQSLQEIHSLTELVLSNNPIGGDLTSLEWQNLQNLAVLDLSGTGLTGQIPESMTKLKRLRFLGLSNNNITGSFSPVLASLPCLGALYIDRNNLTGELQLPELFYSRMGRRFGAWNNPYLCYSVGLVPTSHVPFGVKPCQREQQVTLLEPNTKAKLGAGNLSQNSHSVSSLGFSSCVSGAFRWIFLVDIWIMLLILNCPL